MKFVGCEKAYAKVNFNLKVLPVREDGFHNLESIFQTVSLFDNLIVIEKDGNGCEVICGAMQLPSQNTLTLAYDAFCQIVDVKVPGVQVILQKGIPAGGGLGGGSSDAAALIRALEKLCKITLSEAELDYVAGKVGSDVFFFVHCDKKGRGTALVSGRGEVVKRIKSRKDLYILLIFPGIHSSTKEAYSLVDTMQQKGETEIYPSFDSLEEIYQKNPKEWTFRNTFSLVLEEKYKNISSALNNLEKTDAVYSAMSGSGSTVFGIYTSKRNAKKAFRSLKKLWSVRLVKGL